MTNLTIRTSAHPNHNHFGTTPHTSTPLSRPHTGDLESRRASKRAPFLDGWFAGPPRLRRAPIQASTHKTTTRPPRACTVNKYKNVYMGIMLVVCVCVWSNRLRCQIGCAYNKKWICERNREIFWSVVGFFLCAKFMVVKRIWYGDGFI